MDRGAWQATVHGVTKSDTSEVTALTYAELQTINGLESIISYKDLKTLTTDNQLVQRKYNSTKEEEAD